MSASFDGAPARISPLEFRLLDYLAHQPGRAVPAGELAEHLYGASESGDANAIEAIVARLRRKFGSAVIATRRGFGYLRSEEHTSELQSLMRISYAVFCLKKKTTQNALRTTQR